MAIVKAIASKHDKNFNLHLWNNDITKHGADVLFASNDFFRNLLTLDLSCTSIGDYGVKALAKELKTDIT